MKLPYELAKKWEAQLERIEQAVMTLRDDNLALRAENEKLKADIAGAVDKSDAVEAGARSGLPQQ